MSEQQVTADLLQMIEKLEAARLELRRNGSDGNKNDAPMTPEERVAALQYRSRSGRKREEGSGLRFAILLDLAKSCGIPKDKFCGPGKSSAVVDAKEMVILIGRQAGASVKTLSEITGISSSAVSRRHDAAKSKLREDRELRKLAEKIESHYWKNRH